MKKQEKKKKKKKIKSKKVEEEDGNGTMKTVTNFNIIRKCKGKGSPLTGY